MDRTIKELLCNNLTHIERDRLDMYNSLIDSVKEAGGHPVNFKISILNEMTVLELIDLLGQNNVRFLMTSTNPIKARSL